jgi:hypothetical protein
MNFLETLLVWFLIGVVVVTPFFVIRLVIVKEATAVAFKRTGRFVYMAMEFENHHFNDNHDVVDDDPAIMNELRPNEYGNGDWILRIGGWVFYIYPVIEPADYIEQNGEDSFGDGVHVRLGDITPEPFVAEAETVESDGSSIPLNVKFVSTMRVINPYKWLFPSPKGVNLQVVKRQDSVLRAWVRSGTQDHAQSARGDGEKMWRELMHPPINPDDPNDPALNCGPLFNRIENEWGLLIMPGSIIVENVGYQPAYQRALQAASESKLNAKASVEETAGRIFRSVAQMAGVDVTSEKDLAKFMKKLKQDPSLRGKPASEGGYKEAFAYAEDQIKRDRSPNLGEMRIGGVAGGDLPDGLNYLSLGGGGGAGVMVGGGKKRGQRDNNPRSDTPRGNRVRANQPDDVPEDPPPADDDPERYYR